jgi:hypothetical protein
MDFAEAFANRNTPAKVRADANKWSARGQLRMRKKKFVVVVSDSVE